MFRILPTLALMILVLAPPALVAAAEIPAPGTSTPPASPPSVSETVVPEIPVDAGAIRIHEAFLTQPTAAASLADRPGLETVGEDSAGPRVLTAGQLAKLARAREAIERSRAAGTLRVMTPPDLELGSPLSIEVIEERKLEKLRNQLPLPYGPIDKTDGPREVE